MKAKTEKTHTPGPWESCDNGVEANGGRVGIAILEPKPEFWDRGTRLPEDREMIANAALIAAAPTTAADRDRLLAALAKIVAEYDAFVSRTRGIVAAAGFSLAVAGEGLDKAIDAARPLVLEIENNAP